MLSIFHRCLLRLVGWLFQDAIYYAIIRFIQSIMQALNSSKPYLSLKITAKNQFSCTSSPNFYILLCLLKCSILVTFMVLANVLNILILFLICFHSQYHQFSCWLIHFSWFLPSAFFSNLFMWRSLSQFFSSISV